MTHPLNLQQTQQQGVTITERPYKPKFHNAALYHANTNDIGSMPPTVREKSAYDPTTSQNRNKTSEPVTVTASGIAVPHHPLVS